MTTSAIGSCGSTGITSVQSTQSTTSTMSTQRGKSAFEAVSDVLGMSADDIASAVKSGKSLMDLAQDKGVSSEDLLTALEDNAPKELQGRSDLREIVTQIANDKGGHGPGGAGGPGGPPPGPPPSGVVSGNLTSTQSSTLDTLSSLLDMDSDDLTSAIKDGTLADLLQKAGVDMTDLSTALETALSGSTTGFQFDARA
jgi:lambda repressor-like predicted transcriptional regulator